MQKKIVVAICDDEENALDIICGSLKKIFATHSLTVELDSYQSADELLRAMSRQQYELVFLNINMPGMDGITLGKKILKMKAKPDIIYISSNTSRVFETFEVQPFGFVRKESFFSDIRGVINRYIVKMSKKEEPFLQFELKQRGSYVSVNAASLVYVECFQNMQILHIADEENRNVYSRMSVLEEILAAHDFIRVHKGYIVNCRFIKKFERATVILTTGDELPVGRSKHDIALTAYLDYIHRNGISIIG